MSEHIVDKPFSVEEAMRTPIPTKLPSVDGWKEVPIKENNEPLVALGPFSEYGHIFTNSLYFGEFIDSPYHKAGLLNGTLITQFVREGVAKRLSKAQSLLPSHLRLMVFDAYRPLEVQQALFDYYKNQLHIKKPHLTEEELILETQKFVSLPSKDPTKPSPHNTGGSVDLTIVQLRPKAVSNLDKIETELPKLTEEDWVKAYYHEMERSYFLRQGTYLDMGTPLDHGTSDSNLSWTESRYFIPISKDSSWNNARRKIQRNRRLLFHLMRHVGFEAYQDEWWHYNSPESQMGAKSANRMIAEYGAAAFTEENKRFEDIRSQHNLGIQRIFYRYPLKIIPSQSHIFRYLAVTMESVHHTGNPVLSRYPKAERISPKVEA
jgi:zinc D-Ala-D-Ala dipeptidase